MSILLRDTTHSISEEELTRYLSFSGTAEYGAVEYGAGLGTDHINCGVHS